MALTRQLARLAKILVDSEGIDFPEAEARLRALTLEIVVGDDANSAAAHAAVLTAVSVGHRTFVGGVRVVGATLQNLNSALPLKGPTLGEAAVEVGAIDFEGPASRRIAIGTVEVNDAWSIATWCDGWRAGTAAPGRSRWGDGSNPLSGIAAGALAVGAAFQAERGASVPLDCELDLWGMIGSDGMAPRFEDVFLPGALWLVGLGNLGQAFLWALAALPYANANEVELVLQDRDRVTEENWATSVLVHDEVYGSLKTKVGEKWADAKGFSVRRIDGRLTARDRLEDDDPRVALSGVDRVTARKLMAKVGFECIVDAGLGRTAADFDRYRVTVFDAPHPIDKHFASAKDKVADPSIPTSAAYQRLEADIGRCGTAEVAGASVAAPYVSAVAAAVAISRLIRVASGCDCSRSENGRLSSIDVKRTTEPERVEVRGLRHAGRPAQRR